MSNQWWLPPQPLPPLLEPSSALLRLLMVLFFPENLEEGHRHYSVRET